MKNSTILFISILAVVSVLSIPIAIIHLNADTKSKVCDSYLYDLYRMDHNVFGDDEKYLDYYTSTNKMSWFKDDANLVGFKIQLDNNVRECFRRYLSRGNQDDCIRNHLVDFMTLAYYKNSFSNK